MHAMRSLVWVWTCVQKWNSFIFHSRNIDAGIRRIVDIYKSIYMMGAQTFYLCAQHASWFDRHFYHTAHICKGTNSTLPFFLLMCEPCILFTRISDSLLNLLGNIFHSIDSGIRIIDATYINFPGRAMKAGWLAWQQHIRQMKVYHAESVIIIIVQERCNDSNACPVATNASRKT